MFLLNTWISIAVLIKCNFLGNFFQVKVEFSDGCVFNLSAEFLRIYSPAADSKIRSVGGEKVNHEIPVLLSIICLRASYLIRYELQHMMLSGYIVVIILWNCGSSSIMNFSFGCYTTYKILGCLLCRKSLFANYIGEILFKIYCIEILGPVILEY